KICLLASTAFGVRIPFKDIAVEGISRITPEDLQYAAEMGYKVKLLAIARDLPSSVEIRVHPTMIPKDTILASVNGVYNGVLLRSEPLGATFLYGRGAGGDPTGGAVLADVIQLARNLARGTTVVPFLRPDFPSKPIKPMAEVEMSYYLRFVAINQAGVLAKISAILAKHRISIASVIQKESRFLEPDMVPIVLMTYQARERDVRMALTEIERLDVIKGEPLLVRVEKQLN
ncbi:MAG TPA: homoserine dehydrogenase, partial [bacterium]|nr:homoserine dehydrogenase [bacterium]